jgi:BioD-like phosphotransacetylase family protein
MTRTTLITSLEASTGKTALALALSRIATERGDDVGYMKPKGTRLESNVGKTLDRDPMLARELLGIEAEMADLEPIVYSPTFVDGVVRGREDHAALRERVREAFQTLAADRDRMLLEGGDRYTTGRMIDLSDADVAALTDAEVVLLADYERAGDLDGVLAAADALGDRVRGVLFNRVPDAAFDGLEADAIPFLEGQGLPVLGALPRDRAMAGVSVADLADELGAEQLTDGDDEALVERFVVGAMSPDAALRQFRRARDAAVVTGGDRSEIQSAALEAPGVRCLVLTGGHRPSGAVLGTAAEKDVPVLVVQGDTLTAVERAESVLGGGRTQSADTVEQMAALLRDHAAVEVLLGE